VCGRTFLVGERVHSFVSIEGRHEVCELCAGTTAELGWLPAEQEGAEEALLADQERKPGFFARMFTRPKGRGEEDYFAEAGLAEPDEVGAMPPPAADATPVISHDLDTERYDVEAELAEEAPQVESELPPPVAEPKALPDPAGRGMRPRRLQPDLSPTTRFERAISRFNTSEAGRTVSGLTRTLGAPSVSVGDLAGAADEVRVTVAWELTWYQWGVDLGDELRPVYELSKGFEVDEIDAAARQWNASAHDGRIVMVAPRRREAVDGRPVHR
jgi:hypothetical protein